MDLLSENHNTKHGQSIQIVQKYLREVGDHVIMPHLKAEKSSAAQKITTTKRKQMEENKNKKETTIKR